MIPRILTTAASVVLLLAALTSCAAPAEPSTSPTPDAVESPPAATPAPVASVPPETPAAELTCESMISAGTVAALTETGWTAKSKEFVVGGVELTDGLLCFWADYTVASDHGQLYGWSAISADDAAKAQSGLIAEGWIREGGADGTYITEDPRYAMSTDDDGYGMTYLFGDGWVKFADTRQSLILVEWNG